VEDGVRFQLKSVRKKIKRNIGTALKHVGRLCSRLELGTTGGNI